eukprot:TRINITY_DN4307_c0_g2_i2.p1 TRINITY_DN4307_c0_g2~~TRINITY_DN4307_c0_g2_i2.p1  ORF type:complete len:270 (-),score=41.89 TRINITY_DN4307_c0_g2_i2:101-910(-)
MVEPMKNLGKYTVYVKRKLGEGSFGCVCEAFEDERPEVKVAVKVIPIEKLSRTADQRQLKNEIKNLIASKLNDNVVKLIDVIQTSHNFYLFMEYCNGGNLATYQSSFPENKVPEAEVRKIMKDILNGFRGLVENKIIHRDIKAENILRSGAKWKIADFGFSRQLDEGERATTLVGSPFYMAPQIVTREGNYTNKCDIWSLGVLMYYLLVGDFPFSAYTLEILAKMIKGTSVNYPAEVPEDLKELMEKMFKVQESERISWEDLFKFDWKV